MDILNCGKTEMWSAVGEDYEQKAFKAEKPGYKPDSVSEVRLVQTLAEINKQGDDQIWSSRHSHDLNFGLKPEARYFNTDGTTNPGALLKKGVTTVSISKTEVTNNDVAYLKASGTEDEWGITGSISLHEEVGAAANPTKKIKTRSAEARNDSNLYVTGKGDEVIETILRHDTKDDREARKDRIEKFTALSPTLPDINKATALAPVLLDDDVVVYSFRANSIEGIPAQYLGRQYNGLNVAASMQGEEGIIVFTLIRNTRSNRLRFHVTMSSAKLEFSADEAFYDALNLDFTSCCNCSETAIDMAVSTMNMEYAQSVDFAVKDLAIPVPEDGFKNAVVNRKSSAAARVAASSSAANISDTGVSGCLGVIDAAFDAMGLSTCYKKTPVWCGCATLRQSIHCWSDCCVCYFTTAKMCCCICPCVQEMRPVYVCCSDRCYNDMRISCCCISMASMQTSRSLNYSTSETYVLGKKECTEVSKIRYDDADAAVEYKSESDKWEPCPWYTGLCCSHEYRGDFLCTWMPKATAKGYVGGKAQWVFDESASDEVFIEFLYRDIQSETERVASKGKTHWQHPRQDFIKLKLETTPETVDSVHEAARKFVSLISVPFSDIFSRLDEAKEDEITRKKLQELEASCNCKDDAKPAGISSLFA